MNCPKCGAVIPDDSRFCNYCGEKLNSKSPETPADTRPRDEKFDYVDQYISPENAETEKEQKLWVIFAIIGAGVVFALVAVLLFYVLKTNQKTVINTAATTVQEESLTAAPVTETEKETEVTIPEKTKAETEMSTTETEAETETSPEQESESETESMPEESPEETVPEETTVQEEVYEEREYGGMIYSISSREANLKRCFSGESVIALPTLVYGISIISIEDGAFAGCNHVTHMDIPEGVERIGTESFAGCVNLVEVVIPPTVTEISASAFNGVPNLTVIGTPGSAAESFAASHGFPFKEGVTVSPFLG